MTRLAAITAFLLILTGPAMAAEMVGEWLVKDQTARIGIAPCPPAPVPGAASTPAPTRAAGSPAAVTPNTPLCGNIVWTKTPGGTDENNPDPAKRTRPVMGLEILLAMKQTGPNKWEGSVYNAENGKTYKAAMSLENDDALRMEGCIMGGLLCGGETWTRFKDPNARPNQATGSVQRPRTAPAPAPARP